MLELQSHYRILSISYQVSFTSSRPAQSGTSPAKSIDNRSKCYKQLSDLNNLMMTGVLTEDEYKVDKEAIMSTLKKL